MSRLRKPPIYKLGSIEVLHEKHNQRYVMCRIRANKRLFPRSKVDGSNRQEIQRARVVMTFLKGRALRSDEHVHHKDEKDKHNDAPSNLELKDAFIHNSEHHRGMKHTTETKARISTTLLEGYINGRCKPQPRFGKDNGFFGKTHSPKTRKLLSKLAKERYSYAS